MKRIRRKTGICSLHRRRDRQTDRDRQRQIEIESDRDRNRHTDRDIHTETETEQDQVRRPYKGKKDKWSMWLRKRMKKGEGWVC